MVTVEIDKESDSIVFIEDGIPRARTVVYEDCIISAIPTVLGTEFKKVNSIYYNVTTGKLVVVYKR